ncbi:hypothetical protein I4U23_013090 [Adineta vaga]|nr:hypothetical protein I4U23_013090 [Adineta vaga]
METFEFQTRALYDFAAENSNELSFNAGDILTITSATDGQAWWYARNAAGQVGAIPANYIEVINSTSEPSLDTNIYDNINGDSTNSSVNQSSEQTIHEQPSQQHSDLADDINWFSNEFPSQPADQQNLPNEQEVSFDSSFDSTSPTAVYQNSSNLLSGTQQTPDLYTPVDDIPIPLESLPTSVLNPFVTQNQTFDQQETWYPSYPEASTTTLPENPPAAYNTLSPFGYPQLPQQNTYVNNFTFPPVTQQEAVYENPPIPSMTSNRTETAPAVVSPTQTNNLMSLASPPLPPPPPIPAKNVDNTQASTPASASPKAKPEKSGFLTLKRQKTKTEPEKRQSLVETRSEPPSNSKKDDSDTDGFTESGSSSHNTFSTKSTVAANITIKQQLKFFDKHGIDNYLLHGCKVKGDERVEIAYNENDGGVYWSNNPQIPPFSCKIDDPAKGTKLGGLKSFMEYKIHAQIPGGRVVGRRYKQFDWLHEQLVTKFRFVCVPPLPGKQIAGRFENEFIEERRRQLELWLNRICRHPVLCASFPVQHFVTCDLTEKNNNDWKAGKRRSEKDELREAQWLHCVTFTNSNLTEAQIATQLDVFAQQQPGFETHLRNLHQGLTKYLERHTEIYERDMQRLGEFFSKLFMALQIDVTTAGNKELSTSMSKIGVAFNGIAELYKTKSSEGIRDFNERIYDYIGILSCFPMILSIQRSASEFLRNIQQRGATGTPDFAGIIHRSQVLNHVVLAEINFFQREKVYDFTTYLKQLLHEQIQFYENITAELREAAATFN